MHCNVLQLHCTAMYRRRNYDLYLGDRQFAAISGTFLAWEFELKV